MIDWLISRLRGSKPSVAARSPSDTTAVSPLPDDAVEQGAVQKKWGDAHFDQGKLEQAVACYQEAVRHNPSFAEAFNNLGGACRALNLLADAERYLREAVRINPGLANAHYNLATLLLEQDRRAEAIAALGQVVKHNPQHHAGLALMLNQMQKVCEWKDLDSGINILRRGMHVAAATPESIVSPFIFMALPGTTPEEQMLCAQKWAQSEFGSLASTGIRRPFDYAQPANRKITVGYLSADFHDHATARLMAQVFELHDRGRFTVMAYSYGPDDGSAMRKRLTHAFDQFVDIRELSDADAARKIQADHVDILVDLKGYTANSRSGILALRPTPVQVNYLGYPGTLGAAFVDYLIADQIVIPPDHQKHYAERISYLPICYQPNDLTRARPAAPTRESCGLPADAFVFCCFNQTYKITAEIFDVWCRLLNELPDSVLWLFAATPDAEKNIRREAQARGVANERLIMAPSMEAEQHLARLQCADLFLDTTPVNAHTTCSDALWMGLPVLTCTGSTFASRVAATLLSAIGAPELITYDLEDYYRLALDLGKNGERLQSIRGKIVRNRDTAPLFDGELTTRDLERLYVEMVAKYYATQAD